MPSTTQAGGHPDLTMSFSLASSASSETAKNVTYNPPAGLDLLPASAPICTLAEFALTECPFDSQVGLATVRAHYEGDSEFLLGTAPVFDLEPAGKYGRLAFTLPTLNTPVEAQLSLRGASDYGVRMTLGDLPQTAPIASMTLTLWGVPAEPSHDAARFPTGSPGEPPGCAGLENAGCITPMASGAPDTPFTLNPTTCREPLSSALEVETYQDPEATTQAEAAYPETTGCDQLSFNPSLYARTTTADGYSPSGLEVDLSDPQQLSPSVPSPSELRSVLVRLPEGMGINPALPELAACSDAEAALGSEEPAACPEEALLGTAKLELVGVAEPLAGEIYLGVSGSEEEEEARLLLIAEGSGVELKLPISLSEEAESGQLKLAFEQPQIPISTDNLKLFGGPRALLRTPLYCGRDPITSAFIPWDQEFGTQTSTQNLEITSGPGGAPCLGNAAAVGVKLAPAEILADGKSQTKATVDITDAEGAGIPEQEVKLSSTDPGQHVSALTDNENGTYSATITSSTKPGTSTITAADLSASPELRGSATLTQLSISFVSPPATPPKVSFSTKPPHKGRNRRPRFEFVADVPGASFSCKLDRGTYHPCSSPLKLPKLSLGAHVFSVRASTAAGTGSAAVWHFRVLRADRQSRRHQRR